MQTKFLSFIALCALAGCGGGGGDVTPLFFGSTNGEASANGLVFADGTQTYNDTEGQTLKIKVARYLTDYETGQTSLVISDETVTFGATDDGNVGDFTITIGDETLIYTADEGATDSNGREWSSYLATNEAVSATGTVYSYSYDGNEEEAGALDTEAFFAFGFETDPDTIAGLLTNPSYSGDWSAYGVLLDENGDIIESEVSGEGGIDLTADFAAGTVGGSISGGFDGFDTSGTIASTSIQGNGFLSDLDLTNCEPGVTCTSNSQAAGVFFGANGEEISGVIGFDASRTDDTTGASERLISGAGFSASEEDLVLE